MQSQSVLIKRLEMLNQLHSDGLVLVEVVVKHQDRIVADLLNSIEEDNTVTRTHKYDAFISYRHQEPDKAFARQLLKDLEAAGYTVAIDERDFEANASFLQEMERCVKESQFTLSVVSPRYFDSGNCEEESIICKVMDMADRRRRLIPLTVEHVHLPTWMYNLVGIDFTADDPLIAPFEKLKRTMGNPQ
jgi:hypothetical protein